MPPSKFIPASALQVIGQMAVECPAAERPKSWHSGEQASRAKRTRDVARRCHHCLVRLIFRIRLVDAFCVKIGGSHQLQFRRGNTELQRTLPRSQFYCASRHAPLRQVNHLGRVCLRRTLRRGIRPRRGGFQVQQPSTDSIVSYNVILLCFCEKM